ncbi:hypothetical protein [Oleiharenicola lentus]|uniref:hypothetical protein n=1 Tax=Oleiharenicola lentus TaxID=2508720 RepID=UPI003F677242
MSAVRRLKENLNLVFTGEQAWAPALINEFQAETFRTTTNPSGRSNADVLRGYVGWESGHSRKRWQIYFPPHFTEQEVALYEGPAALLRQRVPSGEPKENWWLDPHASNAMRISMGRLDRYLVTLRPGPRVAPTLAWAWAEGGWLPDESLIAIARDDDFAHGILQSREFSEWWDAHYESAQPNFAFESFPFPWSPIAPLGSLTAMQQELRYNIVRAVREEDADKLVRAVSTSYGWPTDFSTADLLIRLRELNQRRPAA